MTDPRPTEKSIWLSGFSQAWKKLTIASGNSQLFPGPPESLEPDRFSCCPFDQSLFVKLCHVILIFVYLADNKFLLQISSLISIDSVYCFMLHLFIIIAVFFCLLQSPIPFSTVLRIKSLYPVVDNPI